MQTIILFLLLAVPAEIVGTFVGFGASTLLVPAATLFLPVKEAIAFVGLFHALGTLWRSIYFRGGIDWKMVVLFGLPSIMLSAFGSYLLFLSPAEFVTRILGAFLLVYATTSLLGKQLKLPHTSLAAILGGGIVGFLAGLIGTAGALRGAFLAAWNIKKELYLGTAAAIGLGADIIRVVVYRQTGLLPLDVSTFVLFAAVAFVATTIGKLLVKEVPQELFRKVVLIALLFAGFILLI